MFQFSKVMECHKIKTPEEYFAGWIAWFRGRGIKTEIKRDGKGTALWRDGIETTERNLREKNRKGGKR